MERRFENDEKLNYIYEVLNKAKFRNYIYDYDEKVNYCDYIDEYETAIDDRNDKITKLEQALDEIEKIILKATTDEETGEDLGYSDKIPYYDLLEIIQKAKGDVK